MRKFYFIVFYCFLTVQSIAQSFQGTWISASDEDNTRPNSWTCYRKNFVLNEVPLSVVAKIAVETKYWLWINGKLVVYEGGLKRGPNPRDTYYDEVDLSKFLQQGNNSIALLSWFWGGKGFSHNNSGRTGLYFDADKIKLSSDQSWKAISYEAYYASRGSTPNFRLSEPNIFFDAGKEMHDWMLPFFDAAAWKPALEIGTAPIKPWNNLIKRNIPLFKFSKLKNYPSTKRSGDTVICKLPYDGQFSPYFKIKASAGKRIFIATDTYFLGAYPNDSLYTLGSEYLTRNGVQEYESLCWLSGHEMRYVLPKGTELIEVKYRESGYDASFSGSFKSSDPFLNKLWTKAQRTLYVNMRDNYMDCPDRERAQWAGDAALDMHQSFYSLDRKSDQLSRKFFLDLINWQKNDSVIYNPVPETNWKMELTVHSLMPLSELWTYFQFTNDTALLQEAYPALKKYLAIWKIQENGQLVYREGGWDWGDWGDNIDFVLIQHAWYLRALQTTQKIERLLGRSADNTWFEKRIHLITGFLNSSDCWNGTSYRYKLYNKLTDDRANAMMVITGVADETKWKALSTVFEKEEHASPFMEKFVLEALIKMKLPQQALTRMKKRYADMVESKLSTLWELWKHKEGEVQGNSGYNHGWAGGPLILLSQYVAGISPIEGESNKFLVKPMLMHLNYIKTAMPTRNEILKTKIRVRKKKLKIDTTVPAGITVTLGIPKFGQQWKDIKCNGQAISVVKSVKILTEDSSYFYVELPPGTYHFKNKIKNINRLP